MKRSGAVAIREYGRTVHRLVVLTGTLLAVIVIGACGDSGDLVVFVDLKRPAVAGMSVLEADDVKYPSGWPTVQAPTGE